MPDALAVTRALIAEATPDMLRAVLLRLLDTAPAVTRAIATVKARTAPTPRATPRTVPTPRTGPRREAKAEVTAKSRNLKRERVPDDSAWNELRAQVRDAMAERGTTPAELAAAIGRAESTTRLNLYRRKPPPPPMLAALRGWLDGSTVPAVTDAPPFRRGRGRPLNAPASNGADTPTTAA